LGASAGGVKSNGFGLSDFVDGGGDGSAGGSGLVVVYEGANSPANALSVPAGGGEEVRPGKSAASDPGSPNGPKPAEPRETLLELRPNVGERVMFLFAPKTNSGAATLSEVERATTGT
jgi:hypothetical protein